MAEAMNSSHQSMWNGREKKTIEQSIVDVTGKDALQGPILLPVRDRRILVGPRQGTDTPSLYALMREWVQNPASTAPEVASLTIQSTLERVPGTLFQPAADQAQPHGGESVQEEIVTIPEIEAHVENPTLDTHLPRWKALGKRRRLEFERKKALGFQRLHKRLHGQITS